MKLGYQALSDVIKRVVQAVWSPACLLFVVICDAITGDLLLPGCL